MADADNATRSSGLRRMLGHDLQWWLGLANAAYLWALIGGAVAAALIVVTSWLVIRWQGEIEATKDRAFDQYKAGVDGKIAYAKMKGIAAGKSAGDATLKAAEADERAARADENAGNANERAASLEKEAADAKLEVEQMKADNLALQTAMLPRHVGLVSLDETPRAYTWFAGIDRYAGTHVVIQPVAGDPEALNLSNEIAIVLRNFGWRSEVIDSNRSHLTSIPDGVRVWYPSLAHWSFKDQGTPPFALWATAAEALANDLTKAGLGVGNIPVGRAGWITDDPALRFDVGIRFEPPLEGVFVQVGSRPVAMTIQMVEQRRRNQAAR